MKHLTKYLIVGGGVTADAAVRAIRALDVYGKITVLSAEKHAPYDRPPLSKKLWKGKPLASIWRRTDQAGADLRLETRALSGDLSSRTIADNRGVTHVYEKLLLATGGTPRRLPFGDEGVCYFRTLDDYMHVRGLADRRAEFIVIGGGFIGSEIAAALALTGCAVTLLFPGEGIGANIYPAGLSEFLDSYYREKGVNVLPRETVTAVERSSDRMIVTTASGKMLHADSVVAGIGIAPETTLASSLGLEVNNGIVVDEFLRTSDANVYAAGDAANFYSPALGMRRRVEHEDNARTMGAVAGGNMAGQSRRYEHLPYFYSDLFDLGYEAVGRVQRNMDIVEDWQDPFRKGVVYYLQDDRVRGVLLWNTWDRVDWARRLIESQRELSRPFERGLLSA